MSLNTATRLSIAASILAVAACTDSTPVEPVAKGGLAPSLSSSVAQDRLAQLFASASPEVMAIGGTVFADHDEVASKLVFGVENEHAVAGVARSLQARGISSADYEIRITEPIVRLASLRDRWRPTQGGIQIHFGGFLCTMGFNVSHAGGRSFITNSHCTNTQGGTEGTTYFQPVSSVDPVSIATEAADPVYVAGGPGCSPGKVCRSSDASRALYNAGTASDQGVIAKTTGVNTGSMDVAGAFSITAQENSATTFSGTINKVGRTTGWTAGTVSNTCVTVNVSGSNVQLQCQTFVTNNAAAIVGAGDSGSPVFRITSGDNVTLVGILWGGSGSTLFVFSPLKNIQDELGAVDATSGGGPPPPPPTGSVASFTYSCSVFSCTFNASSSTGATLYTWNFGDGNTGSGVQVSHSFTKGNWTVTLNTEPAGPQSTASRTIRCNPKKCS